MEHREAGMAANALASCLSKTRDGPIADKRRSPADCRLRSENSEAGDTGGECETEIEQYQLSHPGSCEGSTPSSPDLSCSAGLSSARARAGSKRNQWNSHRLESSRDQGGTSKDH